MKKYNEQENNMESKIMSLNPIKVIGFAVLTIGLIVAGFKCFGINDATEWTFVQPIKGAPTVVNQSGVYTMFFGSTWSYPRSIQAEYYEGNENRENGPLKTTFTDGGTATMDTMVSFTTPMETDKQFIFHQRYNGNLVAAEAAVWSYLSNVIQVTGPLMSSSEHQASRKSEFIDVVTQQLNEGIYEMKRVERRLLDQFDENGKPITVYATEIVRDASGRPIIAQPSPLREMGIKVMQFSITDVVYDEQTVKQFAQKKEAWLQSESSKAQREQEVQKRLMIEEQGRREKAEFEAKALKEKAAAVIDAQKQKEVAELDAARQKAVAELEGEKRLAVAKLEAETAITQANKELEVTKLGVQTAIQQAEADITMAKAKEQVLKLGGGLSEKDRFLAEVSRDTAIGVAKELSSVKVPNFIISGGNGAGSNGAVGTPELMNLFLLEKLGVLPPATQKAN